MLTRTGFRSTAALIALVALALSLSPGGVEAASRPTTGAPTPGVVAAVPTDIGPWSALGSNGAGNGAIQAAGEFLQPKLAVIGNDVYVAGDFQNLAGIPAADYIAKWNGSTWSALGSNGFGGGVLDGVVTAMTTSGTDLYIVGEFTGGIAKWDGHVWSSVGNSGMAVDTTTQFIRSVAVSGADLYIAGYFKNLAGIPKADMVAKWNGSAWSALGSNGQGNGAINDEVYDLAVAGTTVYVGGVFTDVAGIPEADEVAMWNGTAWSALGAGIDLVQDSDYTVTSLGLSGNDLYVGGYFYQAGGVTGADNIARWNGSVWSALGSDGSGGDAIDGAIAELTVSRTGDLYVGGEFGDAAGISAADRVAKWNGTTWSALGSNGSGDGAIGNRVWVLAATNDGIYVAGDFADAAGIPEADYIAKWSLPANQPDGRIRVGNGALFGNNTYNTTGSGEVRSAKVLRGHSATFSISIQNDGWQTDSFHVTPTTRSSTGYTVTYLHGATDITDAMVQRQYYTPSLAPGSSYTITVHVDVGTDAPKGSGISELVTLTSVGNNTAKDAVQFTVKRAK